jgi:acetyltransferase
MLVARKLQPRLELMLGARHDATFGTVIVLGKGGVAVELEANAALSLAPCRPERVREQLERLGLLRHLAAFRGQPAVDIQPLIDLVVRFSELAAGLGESLVTMEINPLMVTEEGVFAADAVIELR